MIRALSGIALSTLTRRRSTGTAPTLPGPWLDAELAPRSPELVRDYIEHVGGDPAAYPGEVPAHLFPQWGFPLLMRALRQLPYPYARAVNAGCRIEAHARIPAGEPLLLRARVESVDDDGRRALITQRLVTGTVTQPEAMTAWLRVHIPLGERGPRGAAKARPEVPADAMPLATLPLDTRAGLAFALLTGDMNPIHWIAPYARIAGFSSTILHGFATLARTIEVLRRDGPSRAGLQTIDVRFTKPLVLPALVSVYTRADGGVWVGGRPAALDSGAPGAREAYLEGRFEPETTETR
jgi:hypothetical protein